MTIHAHLILTNVSASQWQAPILCQVQTIGRGVENEIVIPLTYDTVSRRHAQIRFDIDKKVIMIRDLNSTGGTRLNGVHLAAHREIQVVVGDRIALAELELVVVSSNASVLKQPGKLPKTFVASYPKSSIILVGRGALDSDDRRKLQSLSPAEFQVVFWVSRGLSTFDDIGKKLFRSPHTVRTQFNSIYHKLHVHSREELQAWLKHYEISWACSPDDTSESLSIVREAEPSVSVDRELAEVSG